jgi:hypothetical protein
MSIPGRRTKPRRRLTKSHNNRNRMDNVKSRHVGDVSVARKPFSACLSQIGCFPVFCFELSSWSCLPVSSPVLAPPTQHLERMPFRMFMKS